MIDLEYIEIDGFLYPNIETGMENLESTLSKYGILHLRYLHEHRREMYRELLILANWQSIAGRLIRPLLIVPN